MKRTNALPSRSRTPTKRGAPNPPKADKTVENTAPKTMRDADAVDLLTDDHLEVSAQFKKYDKLAKNDAPAADRRTLAQAICTALKVHTQLEEEIFYPAARSAGIDADQLDEAKVEHASAKDLIAQLEAANPDDDLYDAKMTVLREYIQHHVVEEHTEMFPKCRRAGMDLVELRGELEARKLSILPEAADTTRKRTGAGAGEPPGILARLGDKLFSED
jgi:hemerythrin-like domain-containing protein